MLVWLCVCVSPLSVPEDPHHRVLGVPNSGHLLGEIYLPLYCLLKYFINLVRIFCSGFYKMSCFHLTCSRAACGSDITPKLISLMAIRPKTRAHCYKYTIYLQQTLIMIMMQNDVIILKSYYDKATTSCNRAVLGWSCLYNKYHYH